MNEPQSIKVSIVIPTYNRGWCIEQAVESILRQEYANVEIVIIDDGSTDDTSTRIAALQERTSGPDGRRLVYFRQENAGAPTARNRGASLCGGDYIVFMDSDDLLTLTGLKKAMNFWSTCDADYLYLQVQKTDAEGAPLTCDLIGGEFDGSSKSLLAYSWHTMGAIYKRKVVEQVGPWAPELKGSQDWEYQVRVKLSGFTGVFLPEVIGLWRSHDLGRIGAAGFRRDYVWSVERACLLIARAAEAKGRCDKFMRFALLRRLIRHTLEAGANGAFADRQRILRSCILMTTSPWERALVAALAIFSLRATDRVIYAAIQRRFE